MNNIEDYFNLHKGRVFLLGNGPSLVGYDLSTLDPNETITMNRSWKEVPKSLYHCLAGDLRVHMEPLPQHILFLGQGSQYPNFKMGCPVILVQTQILGVRIKPPKKPLPIHSSLDLRRGWPTTHCGLFALYAAHWLGFREIYLLGFDGYGNHYREETRRTPDHRKIIGDFIKYTNNLRVNAPDMRIYNCNPNNEYKNLPVVDFDTLH